ncbi:MAG: hypothetical protein O2954_12230 [bacterium]|nr:hypothetical protein [bacterium]
MSRLNYIRKHPTFATLVIVLLLGAFSLVATHALLVSHDHETTHCVACTSFHNAACLAATVLLCLFLFSFPFFFSSLPAFLSAPPLVRSGRSPPLV